MSFVSGTSSVALELARRFAVALDASDWDAAGGCLAPTCEYVFRGTCIVGRDPVIDSYRKIGEWVATTFECVRYESAVRPAEPAAAVIAFRDLIDHGEHHLDFRCEQRLEVGADGLVARIEHVDLPGEPEKAARFNAACGVEKPRA